MLEYDMCFLKTYKRKKSCTKIANIGSEICIDCEINTNVGKVRARGTTLMTATCKLYDLPATSVRQGGATLVLIDRRRNHQHITHHFYTKALSTSKRFRPTFFRSLPTKALPPPPLPSGRQRNSFE